MNPLVVFGGIFLIMSIIIFFVMRKKVVNPNCHADVESVRTTKRNWLIFFIISLLTFLSGIIIFLC